MTGVSLPPPPIPQICMIYLPDVGQNQWGLLPVLWILCKSVWSQGPLAMCSFSVSPWLFQSCTLPFTCVSSSPSSAPGSSVQCWWMNDEGMSRWRCPADSVSHVCILIRTLSRIAVSQTPFMWRGVFVSVLFLNDHQSCKCCFKFHLSAEDWRYRDE